MNVRDKIALEKIGKYAQQALGFIKDMNLSEFSNDDKTISACVFSLSQIGEMSARLSDNFTKSYPAIPWHKIKGLRNRIVHDYDGVSLNIVWDVLQNFLPELLKFIKDL